MMLGAVKEEAAGGIVGYTKDECENGGAVNDIGSYCADCVGLQQDGEVHQPDP